MEIGAWTPDGDWRSTRGLNELYREIRRLGLETNVAELDAFGFTIIENALTPDQVALAREAILHQTEKHLGRAVDVDSEVELSGVKMAHYLLYQHPVFEEIALNEKPLALMTYLLGYSCRLSSMTSHVKGPGEAELQIHSDTGNGIPAPFAAYSQVANVNYALVDYTEEAGCLAIVPGSHRFFRQPKTSERRLTGNERNPDAVPVEVPAGTAIVWHGNTWHGSFPRKKPGLRVNLSTYYSRQYLEVQENLRDHIPPGLIERHGGNDSRMATLLGLNTSYGYTEDGPSRYYTPAGLSWIT